MRSKNPFRSLHPSSHSKGSSGTSTPDPNEASGGLKLNQVLQINPRGKMKIEPSFIAVPGYCTPPVHEWDMPAELSRAAQDLKSISHMHLYTYHPNYVAPDEFSWEAFLQAGRDLEQDLARLAEKHPQRPIIFIAHSLGGVLLKKALLLAHQNVKDPRFQILIECLSGILFLGTPHCNGDTSDPDTLLHHNLILHRCAKVSVQTQESRLPQQDMAQLAGLSAKFTEIANMPILSVFEREHLHHQQRHKLQRLFSSKKPALVDETVATISGTDVKILGSYLSHVELCKMSRLDDEHSSFSARSFLHILLRDIAARHLAEQNELSQSSKSVILPNGRFTEPTRNLINPLNLPAVVAPRQPVDNRSHTRGNKMENDSKIPPHLRMAPMRYDQLLGDRTALLPCFMLAQHSINPDFVGRSDAFPLMDKYLLPDSQTSQQAQAQENTRLFALCGMGGMGKTDLAIEYAFSRRDKFGAVFWLEAAGMSQLAADFGKIPSQLGLESVAECQDLDASIELAKAWLANTYNSRGEDGKEYDNCSWLLIFNNADELNVVADYIPHTGNGAVLITSRDPAAQTHFLSHGSGLDLKPLQIKEAAGLLSRLVSDVDASADNANGDDETDASLDIARRFDGLPLAIIQTAGYIRRRQLSMREFVKQYGTDARYQKVHDSATASQQHRYGRTLATAFNFDGLNTGSLRLLRLLSFLSPDRVQEEIFVNSAGPMDTERDQLPADMFDDARFDLLSSSIIKRNITKKEIWIHRVIQAKIRAELGDAKRFEAFTEAVRMLSVIWPPGNLSTQASSRWPQCERLLPHLERFYQLYSEYSDKWSKYKVEPALPVLMNEAAVYLHERGFSQEGKPYLKLAMELCERGNLNDEPLISDMHLTMGALCNETNNTKGCFYHNKLCLDRRIEEAEKNKKPDVRLAFAHSQMGIAYMMQNKFAEATERFLQCVEMLKALDIDVDEFGFPVCNLGLAYWIQGQYEEADITLTDLLAQREERHGKLDTVSYKTGRVLQALGNVMMSKAKTAEKDRNPSAAKALWDEAFEIHTWCLQQYESTLGKLNHRTADACHKLAEHHIRMGNDEIAQDYLDRALSIWGERSWFMNERARSSFLRGTHLKEMGGKDNVEQGKKWIELALLLHSKIKPDEKVKVLKQADFDGLVCFWSI